MGYLNRTGEVELKKSDKNHWIIFDGDNTLWHTEALYDKARDALCKFLALRGHDPVDVHDFQQRLDKDLFQLLGYDRTRFAKSLVDTLLKFEPLASDPDRNYVYTIASNVFSSVAPADLDAGPVLSRLNEKYSLALLTAGDKSIQSARVKEFPFIKLFKTVQIVASKNKTTLETFLSSNNIQKQGTVVIGDSLRSDILPAVECGLQAVWISNKNWTKVENDEYHLPASVHKVNSLTQFEAWILNTSR